MWNPENSVSLRVLLLFCFLIKFFHFRGLSDYTDQRALALNVANPGSHLVL